MSTQRVPLEVKTICSNKHLCDKISSRYRCAAFAIIIFIKFSVHCIQTFKMARTSSVAQFERAIKDFSKISFEVESLVDVGNAEAVKILNKSIENRKEAISHEASRRFHSLDKEEKENKTKELSVTPDKLKNLILEEVEIEFNTGVTEEKLVLRGNSQEYKSVGEKTNVVVDKKEDTDSSGSGSEDSTEEENSDENSENDSTEEGSTDADSSEEESSGGESTAEESSDGTSDKDKSDNKIKATKK